MASLHEVCDRKDEQTEIDASSVGGTANSITRTTPSHIPAHTKAVTLWRILTGVMTMFFLLCVAVQHNDPDPYLWMPVYLVPAMLCACITWKPEYVDSTPWRTVCMVHVVCCVLGLAYALSVVMETMGRRLYNPLHHEEGRESAGLLVIIIWLCVCRFYPYGKPSSDKWSTSGLLLMTAFIGLAPLFAWSLCLIEELSSSLAHCGYVSYPDSVSKTIS